MGMNNRLLRPIQRLLAALQGLLLTSDNDRLVTQSGEPIGYM